MFFLDTVSCCFAYSNWVKKFAMDIGSKQVNCSRDFSFYLKCKSQIGIYRVKLAERSKFVAFRPVCSALPGRSYYLGNYNKQDCNIFICGLGSKLL